jgi:hypothetical protein
MGNQDVHMETVNPLLQTMKNEGIPDWVAMLYRSQQQPTTPEPPKYKGRTKKDRLEFMRAYETYLLKLENQRMSGFTPNVAPLASCIEEGTLRHLSDYYFQKSPVQITEERMGEVFFGCSIARRKFLQRSTKL